MAVWLEIVKLTPPWLLPFVIVVAVLVVLFMLGRGVVRAWPAIKQFVLTVNAIQGLPEFMERTDATLADQNTTLAGQNQKIGEIHHEVHFNNGSSVKDAAVRTEKAVAEARKDLAAVREGVAGLYGEIETLKAADASLRSDFEKTQPKHPTQGEESQ